jgi:hypothetical protein
MTMKMKKIKHIKDLEVKKMQLRIRQLEQEKKIRAGWNELKDQLNPGIFIKEKLAENTFNKSAKGDLLSDAIGYGADVLSKKFTEIAGEKIESTLQRGVEKLIEKLKPGSSKK